MGQRITQFILCLVTQLSKPWVEQGRDGNFVVSNWSFMWNKLIPCGTKPDNDGIAILEHNCLVYDVAGYSKGCTISSSYDTYNVFIVNWQTGQIWAYPAQYSYNWHAVNPG